MNDTEIERIAAAVNALRPDWPIGSLRTLLSKPELRNRPRRDVAVALAWVACEAETKTPARVLSAGPWWQAAVADGSTAGGGPKTYGSTQADPRLVCGICQMLEPDCIARAETNGHPFMPRIGLAPDDKRNIGPTEIKEWSA